MPELESPPQLDPALSELVRLAADRPPAEAGPRAIPVERAGVDERLLYSLEEKVDELEHLLRTQAEAAQQREQLRELELRSLQHDLALKEQYVIQLEAQLHTIEASRDEAAAALAATQAELAETARRLAEVGALADAIQRQLSYRIARRGVEALKQTGPLYRVLRVGARVVLGR
ncbi:MAG TPA: hypothetical protein VNF07_00020 [Acidimicrobiales bacterium]|nr:hypothetical protein [Acidimicrobiales bacterium]